MATPQLSPGVLVREVDLTVGRAENVLDNIGALAGPFPIGPVDEPTQVSTEEELIKVFKLRAPTFLTVLDIFTPSWVFLPENPCPTT